MNLTVNGKPANIAEENPVPVSQLLELLQVEQREYVTVELNGAILDRGDFDATVKDGDNVEFLYFMGGGR
ncbi:Sulfur carrier protein ThiS [Citrifermentans bremense]|uniref:Sulfur carrier protein ThiS n=1 Tax=Citrifermentans bremense TaxID=60035 RepID=A0A6S6M0I6_9BACT|nr:sulfur carrier protein ThiS [Citrifermentans bremense]BCG47049.1 Sulfur carrier protein ThiS [Citrifermentans bremense]